MERIHNIDKLLRTGIDMMVATGYHNTSINEVIKKAKLPKGSFYYLYKDKKTFALAALQRHGEEMVAAMQRFFSDPDHTPLAAIRAYYTDAIKTLSKDSYAYGCFLGNMGQEMSDVDNDFRQLVDHVFERIHNCLSAQLLSAQEVGEIKSSADADVIADLIINTWHGSLLRMKSSKSSQPLEIFINDFFSVIGCNV